MLLHDKVCLIVGAASLRGIGYATAELFARNGAKLILVDVAMDDRTIDAIATSIGNRTGSGPQLLGLTCDIQSAADCERVAGRAVDRYNDSFVQILIITGRVTR